jgi:hypothetical protein
MRVDGHLFQGFRSVEMLAAGDEPDFELFEIGHFHKCNNVPLSLPAAVMDGSL